MDRYCNEVNLANTSIYSDSSGVGMDDNENGFHGGSSSGSGSGSSSSSSVVMGSEGIGVTAEEVREAVSIQDSRSSGGARSGGGSDVGSRNDRSISSSSSSSTTTNSKATTTTSSSSFLLQTEPTITPTINNTPCSTTTSVSTYHYRRMVSTLQEKFRLEQVG